MWLSNSAKYDRAAIVFCSLVFRIMLHSMHFTASTVYFKPVKDAAASGWTEILLLRKAPASDEIYSATPLDSEVKLCSTT